MDYNCGVYFPQTGEGYVSFIDPADDSWVERYMEDSAHLPGYNRAANRRPLPHNIFATLPDPTNRSRAYLEERANRIAILENVFLGQPLATNYFPMPPSPIIAKEKCLSRRRQNTQNLLSKVCFHCNHSKISKQNTDTASSWSRVDVDSYCSDGELATIKGKPHCSSPSSVSVRIYSTS